MMSFICSCRNKIGAELHVYLELWSSGAEPHVSLGVVGR